MTKNKISTFLFVVVLLTACGRQSASSDALASDAKSRIVRKPALQIPPRARTAKKSRQKHGALRQTESNLILISGNLHKHRSE